MSKKPKLNLIREIAKHKQLINHIGNIVIDYCDGCNKINEHFECTSYHSPLDKCKTFGCSFSPIAISRCLEASKQKELNRRVGQQKQKKKK
jgi:hypothetical protein